MSNSRIFHYLPSHMQLSLGALKSSNENVNMVFLLSVLPSFCIRETLHPLFNVNTFLNGYLLRKVE